MLISNLMHFGLYLIPVESQDPAEEMYVLYSSFRQNT